MSHTADTKCLQRLRQQRQILSMLGIDQWVHASSHTMSIGEAQAPMVAGEHERQERWAAPAPSWFAPSMEDEPAAAVDAASHAPVIDQPPPVSVDKPHRQPDATHSGGMAAPDDLSDQPANAQPDTPSIIKQTADAHRIDADDSTALAEQEQPVAPFSLQGGSYNGWMLMVDIKQLDKTTQTLWQNIIKSLSISAGVLDFPLCSGMNEPMLADASIAGFVFDAMRCERAPIAMLTPMPDGTTHPDLKTVPSLQEMVDNPDAKRVFWQRLSA